MQTVTRTSMDPTIRSQADGYSEMPAGMSRDEAIARLVRLREQRRRTATDGYASRQIPAVIRDNRNLDQSWVAANAAQMDARAALDVEALTVAIVMLIDAGGAQ